MPWECVGQRHSRVLTPKIAVAAFRSVALRFSKWHPLKAGGYGCCACFQQRQ
jgi:hypothetical protein